MDKIIFGIIFLLIIVLFSFAAVVGIQKTEVEECLKWQKEAKQYPNYYLTQWQYEQCQYHHIDIDAPVLMPEVDNQVN